MEPENKEVFAKCRRGNDKVTSGQSCDSLKAFNISKERTHCILECQKCKFQWTVAVGGTSPV